MSLGTRLVKILITCTLFSSLATSATETINIVSINSGAQKTVASALFRQYEASHPEVKINLVSLADRKFKSQLPHWLQSKKAEYNLIFWQGGNRLFRFVRKDLITPLDNLMDTDALTQSFTKGSLGAVTYKGKLYAIPTSYYQWGIYYRKSLFAKYNLQPPTTWEEFMQVGDQLKQRGIAPLSLGNSGKWPAAAWFDYLNLRINGLRFHKELLQGQHSFFDSRVKEVFIYWKELVDKGYFIQYQDVVDWNEALPFIYHRYAAMTLIGNFVSGELPKSLEHDFGFIPFPIIDSSVPLYEDAPLDVLMVPGNVSITNNIKDLVSYITSESFQSEYSQGMGMISPHINATPSDGAFIRDGAALLKRASGMAQFFDRDTQNDFVGPALNVFANFLKYGDINTAQTQLEKLRNQHLISGY